MAWIESHQALGHHPKTIRFAELLRITLPTAVGHLHYFWWWALDFAQTGEIRTTPTVIARACEWRGQPERFWQALVGAGFIDMDEHDTGRVHDWLDYAGRLVEKRAANRERQRKHRNAENGVTSRVSHALVTGLPTVPNQPDQPETETSSPVSLTEPTGPDQPNPPNPPSDRRMGGDEFETCPECELLVSRDGVGHGLSKAAGRVRNCSLDGLRPYQWAEAAVTA